MDLLAGDSGGCGPRYRPSAPPGRSPLPGSGPCGCRENCVLDWEGKRLPNLPERVDLQPAAEAVRFRLDAFERFWRS